MVIVEWQPAGEASSKRERIEVGMRLDADDNFLFVIGDTKHGFVNVAAFPKESVVRAWVEGTERGAPDGAHWSTVEVERGANTSYGDWAS